ncbi:MAG: dolichol-phosphate mannosyltransferase [Solirubrobacteraceae bacterium]|nr:dolichol-phosphate mannosyltransferase [Solirubrobacteraceae bacterium]
MRDLTVIVPTYNEYENLPLVLERVRAAVTSERLTMLVVDDASPDGTGELADTLAAHATDVRVLHRSGKGGLAGAYVEGFARAMAAGADLVVQLDADLSHDPADIPRLIAAIDAGADVALGSRYVPGGETPGWSIGRRLLSRVGGIYAAAVLGMPIADPTGGYRCFTRRALHHIRFEAVATHGYGFQIEMAYRATRAGLTIVEVPIVFRERAHGVSKMSAGIAMEALLRVPLMRVSRPA